MLRSTLGTLALLLPTLVLTGCGDDGGGLDADFDSGTDAGVFDPDAGYDAQVVIPAGDWLYWTENQSLNRRPLTGGEKDFVGVVSGLLDPVAMHFDADSRSLWLGVDGAPAAIVRLSPDDATRTDLIMEVPAPLEDFTVVGTTAYFVSGGAEEGLYRADLSAETPTYEELGEFSGLTRLFSDGTSLYLANAVTLEVTRTDLDGLNATTVEIALGAGATLGDIAIDAAGENLYAIGNRSGGGAEQTLERYPLDEEGGALTLGTRQVIYRDTPGSIRSFFLDDVRFRLYRFRCASGTCALRSSRPDGQDDLLVESFDGAGVLNWVATIALDPGVRP